MRGHWVGPMPVQDFLDAFLSIPSGTPPPPQKPKLFSEQKVPEKEKDMYGPFIETVSESELNLIPGFKIVDTSSHPDQESRQGKKIKPDPSMYRSDVDTSTKVTQFNKVELHFEFKLTDSKDPFCDPTDPGTDRAKWKFESGTKGGKESRGQLTAYAAEWCSRQHRTFAFTIFIYGSSARLIRWDRSGAVVTEKFDYKANAQPLVDFLWYFTRMDDVARGKDDTVREADEAETKIAHDKLKKWKPIKERSVVVFTIQVDGKSQDFLGWGSMADGESLIGRATRAYPVWDIQEQGLRFLKDSWRGVYFERESDIIHMLNEAGVRNVPQLVCGGDITKDNHITQSPLFTRKFTCEGARLTGKQWACGTHTIVQRIHHRFVTKDIGSHLEEFKTSKHLMQVTYDAFIGHKDAIEKCGILHRDVSAKNVMIKDDGTGFLNDWDLAKCVTRGIGDVPRDHERTGTWQFISALNLYKPGKLHTVQDDMESFFHLVLYFGLKYLEHTPLVNARRTMMKLFDEYAVDSDGTYRGGDAKISMFLSGIHIERDFVFTDNKPLNSWLKFCMKAFKQWINYHMPPEQSSSEEYDSDDPDNNDDTPPRPRPAPLDPSKLILNDHARFAKVWEKYLRHPGWPVDDKTDDQVPPTTEVSSQNSSKRARNEANQPGSSNKRIKYQAASSYLPAQGSGLRQSHTSSGDD